jgi:DNA-binding transcriptional ArsR family regulator
MGAKRLGEKAASPPKRHGETAGRPAHEQLLKGLNHPLRVECLTLLAENVASPRQLAEALDEDLSNVSYHVRVLSELGLIELVSEEPVRGAVAHFYKAVERPLLSKADWEKLAPEVRKAMSRTGWDLLIRDATTAIESGTFDARPEHHLTRTSLLLDSKSFARVSRGMEDLLELIFEEQAASAERRAQSGDQPIHAVAAMTLFEMPDPKQKEASADA